MDERLDRLAALAVRRAAASDRAAAYPVAMVALSFVLFVPIYVLFHAAWPLFHSTAKDGSGYQPFLDVVGWADTLIMALVPFIFTAMAFAYMIVRSNRDARRVQ